MSRDNLRQWGSASFEQWLEELHARKGLPTIPRKRSWPSRHPWLTVLILGAIIDTLIALANWLA